MKQALIFKDPSLSLMQIIDALLFASKEIKISSPSYGEWLWGSSASYCLQKWLESQKIPTRANICCPAYICDSVVVPFICSGIEVRFYTLNDDLTPDMNNVLALTDRYTWAWIGVNYFGFPTMTDEFISEGRRRNILIIEDNAHGWFSCNRTEQLGFRGDIGIFSPRKIYPLPDGGWIWIKDRVNTTNDVSSRENMSIEENLFRFLIKRLIWNLEERSGIPLYKFLRRRRIQDNERCKQKIKEKREIFSFHGGKMSSISLKLFNVLNRNNSIITLRRKNYEFWLSNYHRLQSICGEILPLFPELKNGVCPLVFPVLVSEPCKFEHGCLQLGIETVPWPGRENLAPEVVDSAAGIQADYLAGHVWTLPVHQTVNIKILSKRITDIA